MRHVYMTAASDIWRTDGMSKEGECLDCEFQQRLRECASTEQPAFIDWCDSDHVNERVYTHRHMGIGRARRNEYAGRQPVSTNSGGGCGSAPARSNRLS